MRPKRGNPGAAIRYFYSMHLRKEAMARFYLANIDQYPDAAATFFSQNPETFTEENVEWVKKHIFEARVKQFLFGLFGGEEAPE